VAAAAEGQTQIESTHRLDRSTSARNLTNLISVNEDKLVNVEWKQNIQEQDLVSAIHAASVFIQ